MKNTFSSLLSDARPNDIGRLTDGVDCELEAEAARRITQRALDNCGFAGEKRPSRLPRITRRAAFALAACMALLIAIGVGAYAYADAAEYKQALIFFEDNDISTEGLAKNVITKAYREIKSEIRLYSASEEHSEEDMQNYVYTVIVDVLSLDGYEVDTNGFVMLIDSTMYQAGLDHSYARYLSNVRYEFENDVDVTEDESSCTRTFKTCTIKKMRGETAVWSVTTDKLDAHYAFEVGDGVVFSGWLPYEYTEEFDKEYDYDSLYTPAVMKLDKDGNFMWICSVEGDNVSSVVENSDGTVTVFSARNDSIDVHKGRLYACRINSEGWPVQKTETECEEHVWVCDVVPFETGYLGINYVDDYTGTHEQHVVQLDTSGRLIGEFKYCEEDTTYNITDIKVFGGRLYISASVKNDPYAKYSGEDDWWNKAVSDEEFTESVREAYTAVLLVCDYVYSRPRLFYQAEGSCGYGLTVEGDTLVWEVQSVCSASFSPWYGNRPFSATAKVINYRFSEDGSFVDTIDTGELLPFMG